MAPDTWKVELGYLVGALDNAVHHIDRTGMALRPRSGLVMHRYSKYTNKVLVRGQRLLRISEKSKSPLSTGGGG